MGITIVSEESLETKEFPGTEGTLVLKDVLEPTDLFGSPNAPLSVGKAKYKKGHRHGGYTWQYDEVMFIIKGSHEWKVEGGTLTAHEGDFVYVAKGTTAAPHVNSKECDLIFVTVPSLKQIGAI